MLRHGWTLLFHECLVEQLRKLKAAADRAESADSSLAPRENRAPLPPLLSLRLEGQVIVFAWVNDEQTLRSSGSTSDPYTVFKKMLDRGNPPDGWDALVAEARTEWAP